jgi:hypothetical protein
MEWAELEYSLISIWVGCTIVMMFLKPSPPPKRINSCQLVLRVLATPMLMLWLVVAFIPFSIFSGVILLWIIASDYFREATHGVGSPTSLPMKLIRSLKDRTCFEIEVIPPNKTPA